MPVDDAKTLAALDALIARIGASGAVAIKEAGLIVQASGMARTPVGRSGTLRRSWKTTTSAAGRVYTAFVGPTMVYARRIELGFKGPDSLGRVYNQAPNPYVKPAFDETQSAVRARIASRIASAIKG